MQNIYSTIVSIDLLSLLIAIYCTLAAVRLLYTVANYRSSYPLTRLITTNAPNGIQPRAVPRFQICSTGSLWGRQPVHRAKEGKKGEEREGEERREGGKRGRIVPFGSASTSVNAAGLPRTPRRTH